MIRNALDDGDAERPLPLTKPSSVARRLAWTVLVAELPYEGAKDGVFPKFLARENRHNAAAPALWT